MLTVDATTIEQADGLRHVDIIVAPIGGIEGTGRHVVFEMGKRELDHGRDRRRPLIRFFSMFAGRKPIELEVPPHRGQLGENGVTRAAIHARLPRKARYSLYLGCGKSKSYAEDHQRHRQFYESFPQHLSLSFFEEIDDHFQTIILLAGLPIPPRQ